MATGTRYATLDGLRGVAALTVIFYHTFVYHDGIVLAPHGYLAVDFFLMLSGFVIALNFQEKIDCAMSVGTFFKLRIVRLYPIALLGTSLGCLRFASWAIFGQSGLLPADLIVPACILNLLLLPLWSGRFSGDLFPTNTPMWSLFAELVLNVVWGTLIKRQVPTPAIATLAIICGLIALWSFITIGVQFISYDNVFGGFARAAFDFLLGTLAFTYLPKLESFRMPRVIRHPVVVTVLLGLVLSAQTGGVLLDILSIYLVFPIILLLGILDGPQSDAPIREFVGALSYPLYAVHFPMLSFVSAFMHRFYPNVGFYPSVMIGVIASLIVAVVINHSYDKRARKVMTFLLLAPATAPKPADAPSSKAL